MPRLIDADALLKEIEDWHDSLGGTMNPVDWGIQNVLQSVMDSIIGASTIDAEPVRHAQWVDDDCSVCGCPIPTDDRLDAIFEEEVKYCYYCGAKMDAKEDNHAQTD